MAPKTISQPMLTLDASGNFGEHRRFELATLLPPPSSPGGTEVDIEGLDEDGGYLWLIGSHSKKRKKAEEDKTEQKNREQIPPSMLVCYDSPAKGRLVKERPEQVKLDAFALE